MQKHLVKLSRRLSLILRHAPESVGLSLDENGWVYCQALINGILNTPGNKTIVGMNILEEVVRDNDKQRFEFNEDHTKIRARQGHSLDVELDSPEVVPPDVLYHGTSTKSIGLIMSSGLIRMKRHHVHLSLDLDTAERVGTRHGTPVILFIDAKKMFDEGHKFYVTANGVWLTDHVPTDRFVPMYKPFKRA
tara:strand:- start:690 stop:1262 length:573 start_codon:yes stop_codon:yes gene_type:complete